MIFITYCNLNSVVTIYNATKRLGQFLHMPRGEKQYYKETNFETCRGVKNFRCGENREHSADVWWVMLWFEGWLECQSIQP